MADDDAEAVDGPEGANAPAEMPMLKMGTEGRNEEELSTLAHGEDKDGAAGMKAED